MNDGTDLEIGACCPRCNCVTRRALTSTIKNGVRRRRCECKQCGKTFYSIEIREDCYLMLLANAARAGKPVPQHQPGCTNARSDDSEHLRPDRRSRGEFRAD